MLRSIPTHGVRSADDSRVVAKHGSFRGGETLTLKLYVSLQNMLERLSRNEEGQTAVEYGLVVALISLVIAGALALGMKDVIDSVVRRR